MDSFGRSIGLHRGTDGVSSYNQAYFDGLNDKAKTRIADLKSRGFHFKGKLYLDISSVTQYLLNSVEIRIKLELNADQLIINSLLLSNNCAQFQQRIYLRKWKIDHGVQLVSPESCVGEPL